MLFTDDRDVAALRRVIADLFASLLDGFRGALRRERLPAPPPFAPRVEDHPGLLRLILSREPLPLDPVAEVRSRRGFFSLLFATEPLDTEAPLPARHHSPWLTWLFRPEKLDT